MAGDMEKPLSGQLALVTGSARGIGKAIVTKLASLGAQVVVNYARSAEQANLLVDEIQKTGGKAIALGFDVASEEAVEAGIKRIVETLGGLDILVNNAGIAVDSLLIRTKTEDWERTLNVNLNGCFYCSRAAAKIMLKAKRGRIINISSIIGERGNAGQVAYASSKAAILGLTKSMARELGSRGITVNAVTPGFIKTDMTSVLSETQIQKMLEQIPLNRLGEPEDIAETVAFLALPQAGYITGQVIGVNGGMRM